MNELVTYRIVPAEELDRQAVAGFVLSTMAGLYPNGSFNPDPVDLRHFQEIYVHPPDACFFAAVDSRGDILGTAAARPYDGRFDFVNERMGIGNTCEVTKVYIDSRLRRLGIGSALCDEVERYMRRAGCRTSYLHTSLFLPGGYPFWSSRGYKVVADENEWIVHMAKSL